MLSKGCSLSKLWTQCTFQNVHCFIFNIYKPLLHVSKIQARRIFKKLPEEPFYSLTGLIPCKNFKNIDSLELPN